MQEPDEAIERVLAGLREVAAPAGLERRILAQRILARRILARRILEEIAARAEARRPQWVWAAGLAALAVLAGVFVAHRAGVERAGVERAGVGRADVGRAHVAAGELERNTEVLRSAQKNDRRDARHDARHATKPSSKVPPPARQPEVAMAGFPAPPLPLTEEEKLLLRAVRQGHAADLSILIPEVRAEQAAEGDVEYRNFFAAPAAPTEDEKGETR